MQVKLVGNYFFFIFVPGGAWYYIKVIYLYINLLNINQVIQINGIVNINWRFISKLTLFSILGSFISS
jgi:hypothetical protein